MHRNLINAIQKAKNIDRYGVEFNVYRILCPGAEDTWVRVTVKKPLILLIGEEKAVKECAWDSLRKAQTGTPVQRILDRLCHDYGEVRIRNQFFRHLKYHLVSGEIND